MRITVLHGSMRKGNTYHLTNELLKLLRQHGDIQITEFHVKDLNLPFCLSCHQCFAKGEDRCPHRNILLPVTEALESSDGIIVTGVVYSMGLNAAMKNMIDHLSYYFHRPRLFQQKGLAVATTAGAGEKGVAKYLASVLGVWGVNHIQTLYTKIQTEPFSLTEKQRKMLRKKADAFYRAMAEDKTTPASLYSVSIYNSFRGMVSAENSIGEYDQVYWQTAGLKDKVYPRPINPLKKLTGITVFNVLKKVIDKNKKG